MVITIKIIIIIIAAIIVHIQLRSVPSTKSYPITFLINTLDYYSIFKISVLNYEKILKEAQILSKIY